MQRRSFAASLLGASALWPLAPAHAQHAFRSGKDFLTLRRPVATEAGTGQLELVEFFWYSCPHCHQFEATFDQWTKTAPKDVLVRRVPVAFRAEFEPQQRLFFALEALGWLGKLHGKVFQAVHVQRQLLNTDALIQAWIDKQGVDGKAFAAAYRSFGVASKLKRATQLQNDFAVEGVPSLGVVGRYYTDGSLAGSMDRALKVADFLLAQSRAAR